MEMLIITLSNRSKESLVPTANENDISLDQISSDDELLKRASLLQEGQDNMCKLVEYTLSTHISSVNLIASIAVLSNIGKQRPEYMKTVFDAYTTLLGLKVAFFN
jgi:hypothetical protein